jgi:hypothetical protein
LIHEIDLIEDLVRVPQASAVLPLYGPALCLVELGPHGYNSYIMMLDGFTPGCGRLAPSAALDWLEGLKAKAQVDTGGPQTRGSKLL